MRGALRKDRTRTGFVSKRGTAGGLRTPIYKKQKGAPDAETPFGSHLPAASEHEPGAQHEGVQLAVVLRRKVEAADLDVVNEALHAELLSLIHI